MTLNEITFTFENCESLTVDGKYIFNLNCEGFNEEIHSTGKPYGVYYTKNIAKFSVGILAEAGYDSNTEYYSLNNNKDKDKLLRLKECKDLVAVTLNLTDDGHNSSFSDCYYVDWSGDSSYINESLKVNINDRGDVYVIVNRDSSKDSELIFLNNQFYDIAKMEDFAKKRDIK